MWAIRDFGNRIGVWRIMEVLTKHKLRGTAPLNSMVCDQHPQIIDAALELGWEFMGHNQTNSIRTADLKPGEEQSEIRATLDRIEKATGKRPLGWLGAGTTQTWNTLDHLAAEKCRYCGEWTNDEQPYLMSVGDAQMVSLPYTADVNDVLCYFNNRLTPDEYEAALRRQFDVLYRDGAKTGRVLGIPIHPFITGTPQRIDAFDSALKYMLSHAGVWPATGTEIVDWYLQSGAAF
jgi:peptidoglycan/xylan/chitin deacetylase (PgdA/CDA1 family)